MWILAPAAIRPVVENELIFTNTACTPGPPGVGYNVTLEPRLDQGLSQMVVVQIEPEGGQPGLVKERLIAPGQGGPNALALG